MILWNVQSFYEMYADASERSTFYVPRSQHILDKWILASLDDLIIGATSSFERYKIIEPARAIGEFINDLSTWYLRRSRDRFKGEDETDKQAALATLRTCLLTLSKLMAPFTPFLADRLYQKMGGEKESVHLEEWPSELSDYIHEDNLKTMAEVREIVSSALELRSTAGIKVRQPLSKLRIKKQKSGIMNNAEILQLIKDEVNVKHVIFDSGLDDDLGLDTNITSELKEEGQIRDLIRAIQELRKKAGLTIKDTADLAVETDDVGRHIIEKNKEMVLKSTLLKNINYATNLPSESVNVGDGVSFKLGVIK